MFDLVLSYPQWQGSGRNENLLRGALAVAEICGPYAPSIRVPLAQTGEAVGGINRWTAIFEQFRSAQAILEQAQPRSILTAGGDCAVDIAIIDYLHGLYPDLTVLWVDAHLDGNTAKTTPSGDFHGMPVAAIMGAAPAAMQECLLHPLSPARFRYVSADLGDDGEWAFQRENGLTWLLPEEDIGGPVHIHFDLDVLDPTAFPYLAYKDGHMAPDAGLDLVRQVTARANLVGLTITEFAPATEEDAEAGGRFVQKLCEAAVA